MKARDVMTTDVQTCGTETDLAAVAKLMWDYDCGIIPVVNPAGTIVGVVTDRDVCIATATRRLLPERISAAQAMHSPVHTCLADDSIESVLATMKQFKIRRLPVIGPNGRLAGIVSMNDIVLASERGKEPAFDQVVSTLAAICAHRKLVPVAA
jgi:CBS domain-containing protein